MQTQTAFQNIDLCKIHLTAQQIGDAANLAYWMHDRNCDSTRAYHLAELIRKFDELAPLVEALRASTPQVAEAA